MQKHRSYIGKAKTIYLYTSRKCSHNDCSKAVYKSLDHKYSKIHDRLLDACQHGKREDFTDPFFFQTTDFPDCAHLLMIYECIKHDAKS